MSATDTKKVADNPLEDQAEGKGENYYLVNTNIKDDEQDDADMLAEKKVAAYFDPWKYKIARLKRGDKILLYRSGVGVVACGTADGKLIKAPYHGDPKHNDEEFAMKLTGFMLVDPPLTASDLKQIADKSDIVFWQTMVSLDPDSGRKIFEYLATGEASGARRRRCD